MSAHEGADRAMTRGVAADAKAVRRYFDGTLAAGFRLVDAWGRHPLAARLRSLLGGGVGRRTAVVSSLLRRHGIDGKRVVDLGCGDGEVSIAAAALGARVLGVDMVERFVAAAARTAAEAGVQSQTEFRVADVTTMEPEPSDVTMLVGVIEYYSDFETVLQRASSRVRELMVVVDTRGPWWRRTLRRIVARVERITLVYRAPALVVRAMAACGFVEIERVEGRSFTAMAFRRADEGR